MVHGPVCRVLAAAVLALPAAVAASAPVDADPGGASRSVERAALADAVDLQVTALSPAVVTGDQDLVITGTLRNTGDRPLSKPLVRVVMGSERVDLSRDAVQEWTAQTGPAQGTLLAQTRVSGTVAAGGSGTFRLTVKDLAQGSTAATYGAVPISIESGGASLRTFAGYQRIKQYEPLSVAFAVPLTLDPDPALFGAEGAQREQAWSTALGPDSRLAHVLDATADSEVTWAVDPTLTPTLLEDFDDVVDTGATERSVRTAVGERIKADAPGHDPWVLPDTDADLAAVAGAPSGTTLIRTFVDRARPVAEALGGRSDVAWPVDGGYTAARETALRQLFRAPQLAGQVVSGVVLGAGASPSTPVAEQRSATGLPLLAYDEPLSRLLADTTSVSEGVLSTQQFVADSAALLNELPGTSGRSVFVVAPRTWSPDATAARSFLAAVRGIPWLSPTTADAELARARRATPSTAAPVTRLGTTPAGAPPVLTAARLARLGATVRTVEGVATIRDDGDAFARTWSRAAEQLASARWRAAPTAWNTLSGQVDKAAAQTTTAVKVAAGTINFLADSGRLQITVTNDLDVPVEDVKLTVAASNPRLRIDSQPPTLRIGPHSKATVSVSVTALAAGPVPLSTTLTTPDGTVIGQGADVQVRVTPTGDWVYWVLGSVAGLILVLGLVRTFRNRPRRRVATAPVTTIGAP